MKKKAFVEVDVVAAVIIVLLFIFLMASLGYMEKSIFKITESKKTLNNDLFLINLLRAETPNGKVQDILISDYMNEDFSKTKVQINYVLRDAFEEDLCWTLFLDNVIIKENTGCTDMKELRIGEIDARTKIPYQENGEVKNIEVIFQS